MTNDSEFERFSEGDWGVPDFEGPAHARPEPQWFLHGPEGPVAPRGRLMRLDGRLVPTCRHWRQPVELLDGVVVYASAWFDRPDRHRVDLEWAGVGFYLDGSWASATIVSSPGWRPPFAGRPRTRVVVYPWPDLGVPRDPRRFRRALRWLLAEASEGRRVEVGCAGGHGRTGSCLAMLLVLQGLPWRRSIGRIRRTYCDMAVESRAQLALIRSIAGPGDGTSGR